MSEDLLISLFCSIDDFCKSFEFQWNSVLLTKKKGAFTRVPRMALSEIMTIVIAFHFSKFRTFKDFYNLNQVLLKSCFPGLVTYNRFVEVMPRTIFPLFCFLQTKLGSCTGKSYIDSTILSVCHIRRASSHKTFKAIATKGKTSTGWFFGFKLHLVINDQGEILAFQLTSGNVHDLTPVETLAQKLFGALFGDKGYLSSTLFKKLYEKGVKLITTIRKNMKNKLIDPLEKLLLRSRGLIESVNNRLKNGCQIEHHRHRSPKNFLANLFGGLICYQLQPKKPSLRFSSSAQPLLSSMS